MLPPELSALGQSESPLDPGPKSRAGYAVMLVGKGGKRGIKQVRRRQLGVDGWGWTMEIDSGK